MANETKKKNSGALQDIFLRMGVLGELLSFLWKRKLYWLIPMMVVLMLFAILIVLGSSGGGIAPFIYAMF